MKIIRGLKNKLERKLNSDALITNLKGFALGVLTADCVPILIFAGIDLYVSIGIALGVGFIGLFLMFKR